MDFKKVLTVLTLVFCSPAVFAWESYEFDVTYIEAHSWNDTCRIGMTNLGPKQSNDTNVCDDPVEIRITNCGGGIGSVQLSIALAAKAAGMRMEHQAVATSGASPPCRVLAHNLGVVD